MFDPFALFSGHILSNGLPVHVAHWPDRHFEAFGFLIRSGSFHDEPGFEGTAHFVEHVASENALLPYREMRRYVQSQGGTASFGSTGKIYTVYNFVQPTDLHVLARTLELFGSMLMTAMLERNLERERSVILGEFRRRYPSAQHVELETFAHHAILHHTPFADRMRVFGTPESIGRIDGETLQRSYDRNYVPANMHVVALGGLPVEQVLDLLEASAFAKAKPGVSQELPEIPAPPLPTTTYREVDLTRFVPGASAGRYESVACLSAAHPDHVAGITASMLSELLTERLREERAWTYRTGCTFEFLGRFHLFGISGDAIAQEGLSEIRGLVDRTIAEAAAREDLFEELRARKVQQIKMLDLTGRQVLQSALEDLSEVGRVVPLTEGLDKVRSLTMEQVRGVLADLAPERRLTTLYLP